MGKLSDARILGGIGSILQIFPFVSIVGYILTLIAVKYVSDEVHDSSIFSDMIFAVVSGIVGVAVGAFLLVFAGLFSILSAGVSILFGIFSILAVVWIALIVSSIFVRRAFNNMAEKLNVGTFRTAGTLYLIGALLTIVFVGFIILFVAYILQVVAFFSIRDAPLPAQNIAAPQTGPRYCTSCGTQLESTAVFCPKCGAKQP